MHRKKTRRSTKRKVKKGGYYSAVGAIAPGAMEWGTASEMGGFSISSRGGNAQYGSGRKRKQTRKRKTKRGGGSFAQVSASFQGTGSRGIADHVAVDTKGSPAGSATAGAFNYFGAKPSDFSNFNPQSK